MKKSPKSGFKNESFNPDLRLVIHPSFTLFQFVLQKGKLSLSKGDSPSRLNAFTLFEGRIFFRETHSPFEKWVIHLSKRVNGRVRIIQFFFIFWRELLSFFRGNFSMNWGKFLFLFIENFGQN